ncbi:unnamed protein product [Victoria cruziana]
MSFCYSYPSKEEKCNKVHSLISPGLVPFSWEEEPGISKTMPPPSMESPEAPGKDPKLSAPPSQVMETAAGDLKSFNLPPPPPCGFQQRDSPRNGYKRRGVKHQDPFLTALVECTRSVGGHQKDTKKGGGSRRRGIVGISCKHSCAVKEGNMKGEERVLAPTRK